MRDYAGKEALTTGDVDDICGMSTRTVHKWIDGGLLEGWTIPGSQHRGVSRTALVAFMKANGMPLTKLEPLETK